MPAETGSSLPDPSAPGLDWLVVHGPSLSISNLLAHLSASGNSVPQTPHGVRLPPFPALPSPSLLLLIAAPFLFIFLLG